MAQPVRSDVHIDVALSNLSIRFHNDDFVAEKLFPVIMTSKDSNKYFVYGKDMFRTFDDFRAPGTRGPEVDWTLSTGSYLLSEHSLTHPIADEVRDDADEPLKIEADTTEYLTEQILLRLEVDVATSATNASNYATSNSRDLSASGNNQWNDFTGSDPLEDIRSARSTVHANTGKRPNILLLGKQVYEVLLNHPKITDRIKYSQLGVVNEDLLAELFDVEEVVVAGAIKNTAVEGNASDPTLSYVWGKNAILAIAPPSLGLKVLSLGGVFRRQGWRKTETWRQDPERSDFIRVSDKYQVNIISSVAGFLLQNAVQ